MPPKIGRACEGNSPNGTLPFGATSEGSPPLSSPLVLHALYLPPLLGFTCVLGGSWGLSPLRGHLGQLLQLSFPAAVDEQNAQTQEQESFLLGLSDKKDLLPSDRLGPGQGESGSAKARSLRKGIVTCWLKGQAA